MGVWIAEVVLYTAYLPCALVAVLLPQQGGVGPEPLYRNSQQPHRRARHGDSKPQEALLAAGTVPRGEQVRTAPIVVCRVDEDSVVTCNYVYKWVVD